MQNVHFTPSDIAKIMQINVSTVKRWADKGLINTNKTQGGHRRIYQDQLIDFINKQKDLKNRSYILKQLSFKKNKLNWQDYYQKLCSFKHQEAEQIITNAYISGVNLINIFNNLTQPTLRQIGIDWLDNKISIADEHRMSFIIRQHMEKLIQLIGHNNYNKNKIAVIACVKNENHELSLWPIYILLTKKGYFVHNLGINVPAEEVNKEANKHKAEIVVLSKIYQNNPLAIKYIKKIKNRLLSQTRLIIGGPGWKEEELLKLNKSRIKKVEYINDLEKFQNII